MSLINDLYAFYRRGYRTESGGLSALDVFQSADAR